MNNDRMRMLDSADRGRDSRQQRGPLPDPSGRDRGQDRQPQYEARNGSRFNGDSFPGREQGGSTYETYLERRQAERSASTVSIWPASPEYSPTVHDDGPSVAKGKKGSRRDSSRARERRKRSASRSESSSDSSEVQRKKRRDSRKSKKESKSSSRRKDRSKDRSGRSKQRESKKKDRRRARSESSSSASDDSSSSAISVKAPQAEPVIDTKRASVQPAIEDDTVQDYWREKAVEQVDDAIVGPMPMNVGESKNDERAYGGALLAGEGSAMAAYLQSGKRIPRRGEIGLTSNEIEKHEDVGFVMSGSRHRRMNAVRIRKENQVISAEEKRALLLFNQEANLKKEADIIANFKDMVAGKIRGKDPNAEEEEEK
ncbi:ras-induced vulval development antagonist-domain-containing protein [Phlyctochytrium arcticum]|nr:ras-induced vulval development antagonist-domain-containing protein [Phlyctochytrium arcticum]